MKASAVHRKRVCALCSVDRGGTPQSFQQWVCCSMCSDWWHVRCTGVLMHPDGDVKFSFTCVTCSHPEVPATTSLMRHRFSLSDPCTLITEGATDVTDWPMHWHCHVSLGAPNKSRVIFLTPARVLMIGDPSLATNSRSSSRPTRVEGLKLMRTGLLSVAFSEGDMDAKVSLDTKGQNAQRTRLVELAALAEVPTTGFAIAMTPEELLEDEVTQQAMAVICNELGLGLDTNIYRNDEEVSKHSQTQLQWKT